MNSGKVVYFMIIPTTEKLSITGTSYNVQIH